MLEIKEVNIEDIKEYERNAKKHPNWQIEKIVESIEQFGYIDPIAIDETNTIIEGHGRFLALKKLGYKKIKVIQLNHLTETQKRAYIIAHNKINMNTSFDIEKLQEELKEIIDDVFSYGFEEINNAPKGFNEFSIVPNYQCIKCKNIAPETDYIKVMIYGKN